MKNEISVNMTPNPLDYQTLHCSQNDTTLRKFKFTLHNQGEAVETSSISDPVFSSFTEYEGGTEELLPTNSSTPSTSPILADIQYSDGLREDQSFTYRESPVTKDGKAKVNVLKGNTLVWNQLVENGNFESTSGWGFPNGTASASDNVLTATATGTNLQIYKASSYTFTQGHKILVSCWIKASVASNNVRLRISQNSPLGYHQYISKNLDANVRTNISGIITVENNTVNSRFSILFANSANGDVYEVDNFVAFDLTQMFGAGNEPATVEDFTSLFPLPYYSYDSGSMLDFKGTGIKTVGKNQVLKVIEVCNIDTTGKLVTDGQGYYDVAVAYVVQGKQYTFSPKHSNEIMGYFLSEPSIGSQTYDKSRITNGTSTFTAKITGYVAIRLNRPETNAQLELGSTATSYEPYTTSTTNLPTLTYFPTGMKSAGNVYDELTSNKAVTRVGTRAYQSGDESDSTVTTDGTNTNYALATPSEQSITSASLVTINGESDLYTDGEDLVCDCNEDISKESGYFDAKLRFTDADGTNYSNKFELHVERSPQ